MPAVFWVTTFLMTTLALVFVLKPLAAKDGHKVFVMVAVGMPAFAAGSYLALGSPGVAGASVHATVAPRDGVTAAPSDGKPTAGSISSLVDGLAARLEDNPLDSKGWLLLAKSYKHLDRLDEARDAYARATALGETDASLQFLATDGIAADPDTSVVTTGVAMTGSVNLSPALRALVEPTDTVFIFARAPGQRGAPVAVVRKSAAAWPIEFRLTDAQSMVEGMRLSDYSEVVVTARLSRSGEAGNALKGLETKSAPIVVTSGEPVRLIIE